MTEVVADVTGGVQFVGGKRNGVNQDTQGSHNFGDINQDDPYGYDGMEPVDDDGTMPF